MSDFFSVDDLKKGNRLEQWAAIEIERLQAIVPKTADGVEATNCMQGFVASSQETIRVVYKAAFFQDNGFTWWPLRLVYSTREAAEKARRL